MAGTYTNLAKIRSVQNKEPVTAQIAPPVGTQSPTAPAAFIDAKTPSHHERSEAATTKTSLLANQQTSKEVKKQTDKPVAQQANNEPTRASSPFLPPQNSGDTSLLTTKEKTKYGTYLTDEAIAKIKIHAIQTNRDEHQVLQEAVNQYFERLEK